MVLLVSLLRASGSLGNMILVAADERADVMPFCDRAERDREWASKRKEINQGESKKTAAFEQEEMKKENAYCTYKKKRWSSSNCRDPYPIKGHFSYVI